MIPGWALLGAALLWLGWADESRATESNQARRTTTRQGGDMGQERVYSGRLLTAEQKRMADLIVQAARASALNPAFMLALAVTESSLNPLAVGDDGKSTGLFQLIVPEARLYKKDITQDELLDPAINTRIAMRDMRDQIAKWPGATWGDHAEAWTLGERGKFILHRSNPNKLVVMERAARDLDLTLNLRERAA